MRLPPNLTVVERDHVGIRHRLAQLGHCRDDIERLPLGAARRAVALVSGARFTCRLLALNSGGARTRRRKSRPPPSRLDLGLEASQSLLGLLERDTIVDVYAQTLWILRDRN